MGGRSSGGARNTVDTSSPRKMSRTEAEELLNTIEIPATELEGGLKPTKYAQDLFRYYYRISRDHVKNGHEATAWSNFYIDAETDPSLTKRSARGVQTLIDGTKSDIRLDVQLGVFSVDEGRQRLQALAMVQRTFNNAVKSHKKDIW